MSKYTYNSVWNVGAKYAFDKSISLNAMYLNSDVDEAGLYNKDVDTDGFVVGLDYKGAKASQVCSWGLYGKYYDQARSTVVAHTMSGEYGTNGFKGYMVGANYTFAKNIVGSVEYYDLENKYTEKDMNTLWSQLVLTF